MANQSEKTKPRRQLQPAEFLVDDGDYATNDGRQWDHSLESETLLLHPDSTPRTDQLAAAIRAQQDVAWQDLPVELQQAIEVCREYRETRRRRKLYYIPPSLMTGVFLFAAEKYLSTPRLPESQNIALDGLLATTLLLITLSTFFPLAIDILDENLRRTREKVIALVTDKETDLSTVNATRVVRLILANTRHLWQSRRRYLRQQQQDAAKQKAKEEYYAHLAEVQANLAEHRTNLAQELAQRQPAKPKNHR